MLFCSQQYLVFFSAVLALYWALPWATARVWLLLLASFVFYSCWSFELAFLVLASATADYLIGRGLEATQHPSLRRLLLGLSVCGNLGILGYFKYANFFLRSL